MDETAFSPAFEKPDTGLSVRHPVVSVLYFAAVITGTLLFIHPVYTGLSLFCAALCAWAVCGRKTFLRAAAFGFPTALFLALANPVFTHRGVTVLFYLADNPVTLESFFYGLEMAGMMLASVFWFLCYSAVVTSDKFLYVFGRLLPTGALVVSMTLGLIPRLLRQGKAVAQAQRSLGLDTAHGNLRQRLRAGARILSVLVTWALENAVTTADSMQSRGYGIRKRSSFTVFSFTRRDARTLLLLLFLLAAELACYALGYGTATFYPAFVTPGYGGIDMLFYVLFFALGVFPVGLEWREARKWNSLR